MFTFTWAELVTDALLDRIVEPLGDETPPSSDKLRESLALILRNAGGLPVVEASALRDAENRAWGRDFLPTHSGTI